MDTTPLAPCSPSHPSFIDLNVLAMPAANSVLIWAHHARTELMKDLKRRLITGQSELPLKLNSRHPRRLACDQVGCPEPNRQRCVGTFHDGASGEACVAAAMTTPENAGAIGKAVRITDRATVIADELITPTNALQKSRARCFVGEQSLKLRQRARKRQVASAKHIDNHDRSRSTKMPNILPVVRLGDNRISTVQSSTT